MFTCLFFRVKGGIRKLTRWAFYESKARFERFMTLTQVYNFQAILKGIGKEANPRNAIPVLTVTLHPTFLTLCRCILCFVLTPTVVVSSATVMLYIPLSFLLPLLPSLSKVGDMGEVGKFILTLQSWQLVSEEKIGLHSKILHHSSPTNSDSLPCSGLLTK